MYKLIGIRREMVGMYSVTMNPQYQRFEDLIATFDDEEDANDYIKQSKRKSPRNGSTTVFKKNSLLVGYVGARIEKAVKFPHNPPIIA